MDGPASLRGFVRELDELQLSDNVVPLHFCLISVPYCPSKVTEELNVGSAFERRVTGLALSSGEMAKYVRALTVRI